MTRHCSMRARCCWWYPSCMTWRKAGCPIPLSWDYRCSRYCILSVQGTSIRTYLIANGLYPRASWMQDSSPATVIITTDLCILCMASCCSLILCSSARSAWDWATWRPFCSHGWLSRRAAWYMSCLNGSSRYSWHPRMRRAITGNKATSGMPKKTWLLPW